VELDQRWLNEAEVHYRRARSAADALEDTWTVANCDAGLACVAALRGITRVAVGRWGRAERVQDQIGQRLHAWNHEHYERILEPLADDAVLRRGYEVSRSVPAEATARFA
jgi:hypothetical protein